MHSMLGRYERVVRTILLGRTVNRGPLSTFSGSVILLPYATNQNFKYICGYKLLKFSKEIIQVFKLYIFNIFYTQSCSLTTNIQLFQFVHFLIRSFKYAKVYNKLTTMVEIIYRNKKRFKDPSLYKINLTKVPLILNNAIQLRFLNLTNKTKTFVSSRLG